MIFEMCEKKFAGKIVTESAKDSFMVSTDCSKHLLANYTHEASHEPLSQAKILGCCSLYISLCRPKHDRSCNQHSTYSERACIEAPAFSPENWLLLQDWPVTCPFLFPCFLPLQVLSGVLHSA